jgi:1,4-dihydroxy-2-naphthoate octaprenyltransferase
MELGIGVDPQTEIGQVGAGKRNRASSTHAFNHRCVTVGYRFGEDRNSLGSGCAAQINIFFDRDRHPMKRAERNTRRHRLVGGDSGLMSFIGEEPNHCVEMWVDLAHPVEMCRQHLNSSGAAIGDHLREFGCPVTPKFCGHCSIMAQTTAQMPRRPKVRWRVCDGGGPMNIWLQGARPRTLPAAVVPVVVGAAAALGGATAITWWKVGAALVVSLALQVGVNYANDYSDGVRGTDAVRVGPMRLVGSGAATPKAVKRAAIGAFGVAAVVGLAIAATTNWWILAVGVAALAAGWLYTGGPRPYGYMGLGEVFVFVFFGLVATVGTTYVAVREITCESVLAGVGVGAVACALLVINNLRDLPRDAQVGKRTLAVRMGEEATRWFFVGLLGIAAAISVVLAVVAGPWVLLALVAMPLAQVAIRPVRAKAVGPELIAVLGATGRFQLVYGLLLALGIALALNS